MVFTTTQQYKLNYLLDNGKERTVIVKNAKLGLSDGDIHDAIDDTIANDIFNPVEGCITDIKSMKRVITSKSQLF